jgi:hypothetical protein
MVDFIEFIIDLGQRGKNNHEEEKEFYFKTIMIHACACLKQLSCFNLHTLKT